MQPTDALAAALKPLYERQQVESRDVLLALIQAYAADGGEQLDPDRLDDGARDRLRRYLVEPPHERAALLVYRGAVLRHLPLFADMAAKLSWLRDSPCTVCPSTTWLETFPIGFPPWSHQKARDVGPALRRAIETTEPYASHYADRPSLTVPLCIRIVFVLGDKARMKDCDNMAKGLLDGLQGLLFSDDSQIEHLDLMKMRNTGSTAGHILVRCATTSVNDHHDVIHPMQGQILWLPGLDLGPFLRQPRPPKRRVAIADPPTSRRSS